MKEKIRECLGKVPKWVRGVVACAVIVACAFVVDFYLQREIYRGKYKIVDNDFSYIIQIDNTEKKGNKIIFNGWVFNLNENSNEKDFDIILYDYVNKKDFYLNIKAEIREDVNKYFSCEYDYSKSGFIAEMRWSKFNFENINYEILVREKGVEKAYRTGIYISNGEVVYVEPEKFQELNVKGTKLEEIVGQGVLRVYRSDIGVYVYQYDKRLYWIIDRNYKFFENEDTYFEYQLDTTQINKLPQHRIDNDYSWDNIGLWFEDNEIVYENINDYRIAIVEIPKEYSVSKIWIGHYINGWVWREDFRPWYEFE